MRTETARRTVSAFLDIALACIARGWHVHPLKPRDKIPVTKHGMNDATLDEAQIRAWWTRNPNCNVGISCAPSGLCVLARIIHDCEDTKSLFCYKHVVATVFVVAREAFACPTIARHSVCCSPIFSPSLPCCSSIIGRAVPMAEPCC